VVSFRTILEVFFGIHDPTTLNRQGGDQGTQYRSAIFTDGDRQTATATALIEEITKDGVFDAPIVTEVTPLGTYYPAEESHREYYRANTQQPYCQAVISPKLAKFRERFAHLLRT
jgi:peptide-methionine (S)-S-oxide reductase